MRVTSVHVASLLNAFVGTAASAVAVGMIGVDALVDRARFLRMAVEQPGPILLQDGLKLVAALALMLLIGAFHSRLHSADPRRVNAATGAGVFAVVALLLNALLSVYGGLNAGRMSEGTGVRLVVAIGGLAFVVLASSGVWYLLTNLVALRAGGLPRWLCRLGVAVGVASFLPPLALVALVLSVAWSAGLAWTTRVAGAASV